MATSFLGPQWILFHNLYLGNIIMSLFLTIIFTCPILSLYHWYMASFIIWILKKPRRTQYWHLLRMSAIMCLLATHFRDREAKIPQPPNFLSVSVSLVLLSSYSMKRQLRGHTWFRSGVSFWGLCYSPALWWEIIRSHSGRVCRISEAPHKQNPQACQLPAGCQLPKEMHRYSRHHQPRRTALQEKQLPAQKWY